jgi:hypothetical protein
MQWEEITFELIFFHVIFYCEVTHKKVQRMKNDNIFSTCAAGFALLNLPKGKSLGRSKPETNSSNEQAH